MFRRLHRQMTVFCTLVTGAICVVLSLLCLLFARQAITRTGYASFEQELGTMLANLQSQTHISHQWLTRMQEESRLRIRLFDNGEPLFYEQLHQTPENDALFEKALAASGTDIFHNGAGQAIRHEEFTLKVSPGRSFYVSTGFLTRENGLLSFIILYDRSKQSLGLLALSAVFFVADIATLCLLWGFSYLFTQKMLLPIERSQKKQQQFIAAASHELRSPLTVILSGVESVEKSTSPEQATRFLSIIRQEGLHMQHLIADMLLLANAQAGHLPLCTAPEQPDEILLPVYEKYERLAEKNGVSLSLWIPEGFSASCICDRERIIQMLSVLIDNALSYTPVGGSVLLFLTPNQRDVVTLGVADTGPGIPDDDKDAIFEPFYRADPSQRDHTHFGLGLGTAREIAAAHHGSIRVEDAVCASFLPPTAADGFRRSGSVFYVELPSSPESDGNQR